MNVPCQDSSEALHQLVVLDDVAHELGQCNDVGKLKDVRDRADAIRNYAKAAQKGLEVHNRAAEIKLRAERQAGRLLSQLNLRGGDRKSNGRDDRLKLDDLGIGQSRSKRWQN